MKALDAIVDAVSVEIPGLVLSHVVVGRTVMDSIVARICHSAGVQGLNSSGRLTYRKVLFVYDHSYGTHRVDAVYHKTMTEEVSKLWSL